MEGYQDANWANPSLYKGFGFFLIVWFSFGNCLTDTILLCLVFNFNFCSPKVWMVGLYDWSQDLISSYSPEIFINQPKFIMMSLLCNLSNCRDLARNVTWTWSVIVTVHLSFQSWLRRSFHIGIVCFSLHNSVMSRLLRSLGFDELLDSVDYELSECFQELYGCRINSFFWSFLCMDSWFCADWVQHTLICCG